MYVKGNCILLRKKGKALFGGGGFDYFTETRKTLNVFSLFITLRQLVLRSFAKRETAQIII